MRMMIIWIFSPKAAAVSPPPPPMSLMVPWIKGLYLYHSQLAWYQFITATFCHFSLKTGTIYRAICFSCIFLVNSLNLPVVQQRRLLWQMEVDSYGRLVRETGRLSCNL
ncbi:hypothetical protein ACS0TY_007111 [Phlomoides rotata]